MTDPGPEKPGGRIVVLLLLGLAVLVGGAYAAAYLAAGDRVPRGTAVAGVEVGGLTPAEAVEELERGLGGQALAPIEVSVDGNPQRLQPVRSGLSVDYAASVEAAGGGRSWDPARLWDYYTGGDELDPVVEIDEDAMTSALDDLGAEVGTPPRDGAVEFRGRRVVVTDARPGQALDLETARQQIEAVYLAEGDSGPVELSLTAATPDIDAGDVQEALDNFANPAISAPVTLLLGQSQIRLTPRDYGRALSLRPRDGELEPAVDRTVLTRILDSQTTSGDPVDATVRLVNGNPTVIPSKPGVTYRPGDVQQVFLKLVTKPSGKREQRVEGRSVPADRTTKEARALEIDERVSTFTTYYPHADYRNVNLGRAAEVINGTILEPGDEFSLNGIVGERTKANGFTEGYIISDGILVTDLGGGVSQIATTTFNAAFFAGLEDVEHKPHSFYIDRYPIGREATVAWGAVDLRFKNDSPYGVLVTAEIKPSTPSTSGSVTVSMWSTKVWDITTSESGRYNITEEETRQIGTKKCHPNQGYGGFDIDVFRYFREPGASELVRKEKFHTTYTPSDTVVCTNPNAEDS